MPMCGLRCMSKCKLRKTLAGCWLCWLMSSQGVQVRQLSGVVYWQWLSLLIISLQNRVSSCVSYYSLMRLSRQILIDKLMFNPNAPQSPYYITTWRNNNIAGETFSRFFGPLKNNLLPIFGTCVICIVAYLFAFTFAWFLLKYTFIMVSFLIQGHYLLSCDFWGKANVGCLNLELVLTCSTGNALASHTINL